MRIPRVLITVPVYHAVEPAPFWHFMGLAQVAGRDEERGLYKARYHVAGPKIKTVNARNMATEVALESFADFVLLVDDDMCVPPDLLTKLLAHDVDIVTPLFFRSTPPIAPLIFDLGSDGTPIPIFNYPDNSLFETPGGAGTGVMLIKTKVFRSMEYPWWRGSVDAEQGEDTFFCKQARARGFKTWCDSSVKVAQMGLNYPIGEPEYLASIDTNSVR